MQKFTKEDIKNLVDDFQLYSGNVKEISEIYGPHEHNAGSIGGEVRTAMNSFKFSATPMFCDRDYWTIELPDIKACLELGHGRVMHYRVPKIHLDPHLQKEYFIANDIYDQYNDFNDLSKIVRLGNLESLIGLDTLKTANDVMQMIILTYRSYPQKGSIPRARTTKM